MNGIAPEDHGAEVISTYMIICYFGNLVLVIGVGLLSALLGHAIARDAFVATIALLRSSRSSRDGVTHPGTR